MRVRTPITLVSGPLGSGKTTLLRHVLASHPKKIAILMNEFGEISIDSKVLEGKSVRIAELEGGCVCCSLLGEFEEAVGEILDTVDPEMIVVETTGVAEPDALVFDIRESLPQVRLDGVVTVADADAMLLYPRLGHTTRMQIEAADTILLNKVDLVSPEELNQVEKSLRRLQPAAALLRTHRCRVDPALLFGIAREREVRPSRHVHQPEFESFYYETGATFDRNRFEHFATGLSRRVYRAKGFIRLPEGTQLFNFVAGRWELEPFEERNGILVFIGRKAKAHEAEILDALKKCEM